MPKPKELEMEEELGEEEELDESTGQPKAKPQADPRIEQILSENASLKKQIGDLTRSMTQLLTRQPKEADNNQPDERERLSGMLAKAFQKHGYDIGNEQNKKLSELWTDILHEAFGNSRKEFEDWKKAAEGEMFGLEDEVGLINFLMDPTNASLNRNILPEVRRIYGQERLWNKPDGHDGDWTAQHGYKKAYERFAELQKLANPEGAGSAPKPKTRPATSSMGHPPAKSPPAEPGRKGGESLAAKYADEHPEIVNPDTGEVDINLMFAEE